MKIKQRNWTPEKRWEPSLDLSSKEPKGQLILAFGDRELIENEQRFQELKNAFPNSHILMASTSGNILETSILDQSIVTTEILFEKDSSVAIHRTNINEVQDSFEAGKLIGLQLKKEGLIHVFIISDGHLVNGSELVKGLLNVLPTHVAVTGGLAGDGTSFKKTIVGIDASPCEGEIVAIGFYGSSLRFGFGSVGGWDPFGIERKITRSKGNVLYELDRKSDLDLYKNYLGDQSNQLPGSAMLFPLAIRPHEKATPLVRTILSIDEETKSMVFAGDIPEGWYAQLMKANFDRLVDGAAMAASESYQMMNQNSADLAILISCVGRRIVLDQRTEEEIESVREIIGKKTIITGFYSYGEIAPTAPEASCQLHNQTMTITTITEK